jgi:hypothetical protein
MFIYNPTGGATLEDRIPRGGHIRGSDPLGGGPNRRIRSWGGGGVHQGIDFDFEYRGKLKFIFETAFGYE